MAKKNKSSFVKGKGKLTAAEVDFETWLTENNYYSVNSSNYPASIHAITLVQSFIDDHPEHENKTIDLEEHADDIGWISDLLYEDEGEDTDIY